jgi:hypothetical protein
MNQLTVTLIVVIGLLGGFYGGFKYGQNHPPPSANTTTNTPSLAGTATGSGGGAGAGTGTRGGGGGGGGGFGGNAISGQITAVGNGTITLHETNGTDLQVNVSSARISKTSQGTAADLAQNTPVTVVGSTDASGTVNATVIQIGGGFGRASGGGGTQPSPSPSS